MFAEDEALVALDWGHGMNASRKVRSAILNKAGETLIIYFKTGNSGFSGLPLAPQGTAFQIRAWKELQKIKAGNTRSYTQLAKTLKSAPRAVGRACGTNPIIPTIPCHRVLNADGRLGGYSAGDGAKTKEILLRHEGIFIPHTF